MNNQLKEKIQSICQRENGWEFIVFDRSNNTYFPKGLTAYIDDKCVEEYFSETEGFLIDNKCNEYSSGSKIFRLECIILDDRYSVVAIGDPSSRRIKTRKARIDTLRVQLSKLELEQDKNAHELLNYAVQQMLNGEIHRLWGYILEYIFKIFESDHGSIWRLHDNRCIGDKRVATLEQILTVVENKEVYLAEFIDCLDEGNGYIWDVLDIDSPSILRIDHPEYEKFVNVSQFQRYEGKSLLLMRLNCRDELFGVIVLAVTRNDLDFEIEQVSKTLPQLVDLTRVAEESERRERMIRSITTLDEASVAEYPINTIEIYSYHVSMALRKMLGVEVVSVLLNTKLNANSNQFQLVAISEDDLVRKVHDLKIGTEIEFSEHSNPRVFSAIQERKPTIRNMIEQSAVETHSACFSELPADAMRNILIVPIVMRNGGEQHVVGVVRCINKFREIDSKRSNYAFSMGDLEICETFSRLIVSNYFAYGAIENLNIVNKRLRRSEQVRKHETASPLASIRANTRQLETLLGKRVSVDIRQLLEEIREDADICSLVVEETSSIIGLDLDESPELVKVRTMLDELCKFLQRYAFRRSDVVPYKNKASGKLEFKETKKVKITVSGSCQNTELRRSLVQRVFYNLGVNAIKYSKPGGYVEIVLKELANPDRAIISFLDDGIGVPVGEEQRIFEEDYRATNARLHCEGEGIGLPMAESIIKLHGGRLFLDRTSEARTKFVVEIPIKKNKKHPLMKEFDGVFRVDGRGREL